MLPAGLRELDSVENRTLNKFHIGEALGKHYSQVSGALRVNRHFLGDQIDGGFIPMVRVDVGQNHRIRVDDFGNRHWQRSRGIAQVAVGCAFKARIGTLLCQVWIHQKPSSGVIQNNGCVSNLLNFHAVLTVQYSGLISPKWVNFLIQLPHQ
ncbi:hypothetical protein D3C80_1580000 [compost metagenome]